LSFSGSKAKSGGERKGERNGERERERERERVDDRLSKLGEKIRNFRKFSKD
jgi:hypothetical protein